LLQDLHFYKTHALSCALLAAHSNQAEVFIKMWRRLNIGLYSSAVKICYWVKYPTMAGITVVSHSMDGKDKKAAFLRENLPPPICGQAANQIEVKRFLSFRASARNPTDAVCWVKDFSLRSK
jgi:hypothetical protein